MWIFRKIRNAQRVGWIRTFELLFNRFVPPWIFRYSMGSIYDFDIDSLCQLGDEPPKHPLRIECLEGARDREALRELTWNTVPEETTRNDLGYAVYDGESGELLGGVWGGVDSFLENNLGIQFDFADNQAWLYNAFTHPQARGKGVYNRLIAFAAADLRRRGFDRIYGIVQPWNRISKKMHEKHSRGICGSMSALRFLKWVKVSYRGNLSVDQSWVMNVAYPARVRIH